MMTNLPEKGHGQGHVTHFKLWCPLWYLWNGWSYNCQILHAGRLYQILAYSDKPQLKGASLESCDPCLNFATNHIYVIGEARLFKFRVLIDTEEYECMYDIFLPKGICSESRDLFKFWEINDNILLTVQDRDIVAI